MSADRFNDLVGLCSAIQFESPSSWLTRAALGQGTAVMSLAKHLGWVSWQDVDRSFAERYAIGLPTGVPAIAGLEVARRVMVGFRESKCAANRLLLFKGRKIRYRFCPLCLLGDSTPYVRQHWRFSCWYYCPDHQCLLEEACPHCGAAIQLPVSLVGAGPKGQGVAELSDCVRCGGLLTEATPRGLPSPRCGITSWQRTQLSNGRAMIAALYEGWFQLQGTPLKRPLSQLRLLDRYGLIPRDAL